MNFDLSILEQFPVLLKGIGSAIKGVLSSFTGAYYQPVLIAGALLAGWFLAKTYVPSKWATVALYAGIIYLIIALS